MEKVQETIELWRERLPDNRINKGGDKSKNKSKPVKLSGFTNSSNVRKGIPYSLKDYFELADWTGRVIHPNIHGYIPGKEPEIVANLGINTAQWLDTVKEYGESYHAFVGSEKQLKEVCESSGKKWVAGIKSSRILYS